MPQLNERKRLDPKLRRLVHHVASADHQRLQKDVERAFIASAPPAPAAAVQAPAGARLFKRVLVKLAGDRVPSTLADLQWIKLVDDIYTVNVPLEQLTTLAATPGVVYVSAGHVITPDLNTSLAETRATLVHPPMSVPPFTGNGVVVGVIDSACDYTLDDFRRSQGGPTRIAFLWDQSLTPTGAEHSPAGFPHGVEYTGADIDGALTAPAGAPPVVRHEFGAGEHGTHVLAIAAGNGNSADARFPAGVYVGAAPEATIIFVRPTVDNPLPKTSLTDSVHIAEAITYIFQKAAGLGMPCVINLSMGQNGGGHDGESLVERAIDRLLEEPGRAVVVAAGNEQVWRGHASGTLAPGQSRILNWRVGGGSGVIPAGSDRTPNELEIWYSSRDRFSVFVMDPLGESTPVVHANGTLPDHALASGNRVFVDSERFTVLNGDARIYVEVSPGTRPFVTPGVWAVVIMAQESVQGQFDAWIERDERDRLNNFADQSMFEAGDFDPVKTLGTPATSRRTIAVANYQHLFPKAINVSSSHGPTRDGRLKPEVAAPGTGILSANSLGGHPAAAPAIGPYPMRIAMSGTSMSAPHVTGIVALMLERNPRLTAAQISKILAAAARPRLPFQPRAFSNAYGFGLIDARAAVDLMG